MQFTDAAPISSPRITASGFMVVDAAVARTGIQEYTGREVGRPAIDRVRLYRPEDQVFSHDTLASFAHRTVTDDHPPQMVDAGNWKRHVVGMCGDSVARDGDHVRVPFTLMDAATIAKVKDGKRELSCGYTCDIEWTAGKLASGETYDGIQTNIRGNHLAIVDRGRAGATCCIGDSWTTATTEAPDMAGENTRAVIVDGVSYTMTDQAAQLIERQAQQIKDAKALVDTTQGQMAALKSTHQQALDAKDGEIAALKAKVPDAAMLDAMLTTRAATITAAKRVLGDSFDATGKSEGDIRRAAVGKRLGDAAIVGKSDDYIAAAFDTLKVVDGASGHSDPIRQAIIQGAGPVQTTDVADPYEVMCAGLRDAWKGEKK